MKDINGRAYLTVAEAKFGMMVQVDSGFNCIPEGQMMPLRYNKKNELCLPCTHGDHSIEESVEIDEVTGTKYYIGIYPVLT